MAEDPVTSSSNPTPWWRSASLLYAIIPVGLVVFLAYALLWPEKVIQPLSDISSARGVITFIICLTTAGIALALTLHIALGDRGDLEKRFDFGKQILSTFVGILGTIVGFYFGSTVTGTESSQSTLKLTTAQISPPTPKPGEKVTLSLSVSGGKAPYTYSVTFHLDGIKTIENIRSEQGLIVQDVTIPTNADIGSPFSFQVEAKDSENRTATYNADRKQRFSLKPDTVAQPDSRTG